MGVVDNQFNSPTNTNIINKLLQPITSLFVFVMNIFLYFKEKKRKEKD